MTRSVQTHARKIYRRLKGQRTSPPVVIGDVTGSVGRNQVIPRVVYQTAESREVHPLHAKSTEKFRSLNGDLDFVFFDQHDRDRFMEERWGGHPIFSIYNRSRFGQMKADIFRYCVIYQFGGYYLDFNKGIRGSFTAMHPPEAEGLVSYEKNASLILPPKNVAETLQNPFNYVMQWAFGFKPGHHFLNQLINEICQMEPFFRHRIFSHPKNALLTLTATGMFTRTFRQYVGQNGMGGIFEAGEDFFGKGIFRLKGSKLYWGASRHYSEAVDEPLFS